MLYFTWVISIVIIAFVVSSFAAKKFQGND